MTRQHAYTGALYGCNCLKHGILLFCQASACILCLLPQDGAKPRLRLSIHKVKVDVWMQAQPRLFLDGPVHGCNESKCAGSAGCCKSIGMLDSVNNAVVPKTIIHRTSAENVFTEKAHADDEEASLRHRIAGHYFQHLRGGGHGRILIEQVDVVLLDATVFTQSAWCAIEHAGMYDHHKWTSCVRNIRSYKASHCAEPQHIAHLLVSKLLPCSVCTNDLRSKVQHFL